MCQFGTENRHASFDSATCTLYLSSSLDMISPKKLSVAKERRIRAAAMVMEFSQSTSTPTEPVQLIEPTMQPSTPSRKRKPVQMAVEDSIIVQSRLTMTASAAASPPPTQSLPGRANKREGAGHHAVSLMQDSNILTEFCLACLRVHAEISRRFSWTRRGSAQPGVRSRRRRRLRVQQWRSYSTVRRLLRFNLRLHPLHAASTC